MSKPPTSDFPWNLQRTIEYSRVIVSALPTATVMVVGADERVRVAEGQLLRRHGFDAERSSAGGWTEILPAATRDELRSRYAAALIGETQNFDYWTADGRTLCWVQLTPMYLGDQVPAAVVAIIQDLTERNQLVSQLRIEREHRLMAEEMAGLGHWELDPEAGAVTMSESLWRVLGLAPQRDISIDALVGFVAEEDRDQVLSVLELVAETSEAQQCECGLRTRDGRHRRVMIRARRSLGADGRAIIIGTSTDITELRAAEQVRAESEVLLRQGFDGSPVGMAVTEPAGGRYLRVNDALCRLLGRGRDELLSMSTIEVTDPEDAPRDAAYRDEMLASTRDGFEHEKRYVRPDGSKVWVSLHVVPVYGHDGEVRRSSRRSST